MQPRLDRRNHASVANLIQNPNTTPQVPGISSSMSPVLVQSPDESIEYTWQSCRRPPERVPFRIELAFRDTNTCFLASIKNFNHFFGLLGFCEVSEGFLGGVL